MVNTTSRLRLNQKPLSEDLLLGLLAAGVLTVGAFNPAFLPLGILLKTFKKENYRNKKKFYSTFRYLKTKGFLNIENRKGQCVITLTEKGEKKARVYELTERLRKLKPPPKSSRDRKNYLILFDIESGQRAKRDAFRFFLRRMECVPLQKSVWLSRYDCRDDIKFLKEFFELQPNECRVVIAEDIGGPVGSGLSLR